jgi:hypothetical protein
MVRVIGAGNPRTLGGRSPIEAELRALTQPCDRHAVPARAGRQGNLALVQLAGGGPLRGADWIMG